MTEHDDQNMQSTSEEPDRATRLQAWRRGSTGPLPVAVPVPVQHAWYRMTGGEWTSLALVPVDSHVRAAGLARNFGQLAAQEPQARILVVNASLRGCWTPTDPRPAPPEEIWSFLAAASTTSAESSSLPFDYLDFVNLDRVEATRALASAQTLLDAVMLKAAYRRCIFAVDDVMTQPEATPLVRAVDMAVLCVARGRSTLRAVRHALDLFGPSKIAGAVLLEPSTSASAARD
ncbi:MAG: hypothetical protein ABIJ09_08500 [Pseudomonadota bacterium]